MFEKKSVRDQYQQAYRAIRAIFPRQGETYECRTAHQNIFFEMFSATYDFVGLCAYGSFADRHNGIHVNWRLHDRLQYYVKSNPNYFELVPLKSARDKSVTQAWSHITDR